MSFKEAPSHNLSLIDKLSLESQEVDYKRSIVRDLNNLLNTRINTTNSDDYKEVFSSILTYGLNSFSNIEATTKEAAQLIEKELCELLEKHEPRLSNVDISVNKVEKQNIIFKISAMLLTDSSPTKIEFDSYYRPTLQQFDLNESVQ